MVNYFIGNRIDSIQKTQSDVVLMADLKKNLSDLKREEAALKLKNDYEEEEEAFYDNFVENNRIVIDD